MQELLADVLTSESDHGVSRQHIAQKSGSYQTLTNLTVGAGIEGAGCLGCWVFIVCWVFRVLGF